MNYNLGILGGIMLLGLIAIALIPMKGCLTTVEGDFLIKEMEYRSNLKVKKWTTVRKYDRSYAPSCSWNVDLDIKWVCDTYSDAGDCKTGHYEDEYDYSLRDWKNYREITYDVRGIDSFPRYYDSKWLSLPNYKITHRYVSDMRLTGYLDGKIYTFTINDEEKFRSLRTNETVKVVIRQRNNNFVKFK